MSKVIKTSQMTGKYKIKRNPKTLSIKKEQEKAKNESEKKNKKKPEVLDAEKKQKK